MKEHGFKDKWEWIHRVKRKLMCDGSVGKYGRINVNA